MDYKVTIDGPKSQVDGFIRTIKELQDDRRRLEWLLNPGVFITVNGWQSRHMTREDIDKEISDAIS